VLAYVVNSLNPGGTEKLVVEMSLAVAAEWDVHVFCLDEPGAWADSLRMRGIAVHTLWRQPGLDLRVAARLANHFRRIGARLVHAHQCTAWFYAALSRLLYGAPRLLLEEHGRFYPEVDNRPRRFMHWALIRRLTQAFVAVSADIRERLRRYEGLGSAEIAVIYNGVQAPALLGSMERRELRESLGFTDSHVVVGTVGRFDVIKNLPLLLRSVAAAHHQLPQLRCLLVGHGPEFGATQALAAELGITKEVVFTGFREDARRLVQTMDLFVLASLSEGTSMALLEAMAGGVPVAVTAVGGNPEIVIGGETGWTVASGDEVALTAAFVEAATDASRRIALAAAGQRRYRERFTFEAMMAQYGELYRRLAPGSAA
jgi:glycosyltransferase involved in cell wall biosynthesis